MRKFSPFKHTSEPDDWDKLLAEDMRRFSKPYHFRAYEFDAVRFETDQDYREVVRAEWRRMKKTKSVLGGNPTNT